MRAAGDLVRFFVDGDSAACLVGDRYGEGGGFIFGLERNALAGSGGVFAGGSGGNSRGSTALAAGGQAETHGQSQGSRNQFFHTFLLLIKTVRGAAASLREKRSSAAFLKTTRL